jgi:hypothetical protein
VHLAVDPGEPAAGVDDDGGVVSEARKTPFEDRGHGRHAEPAALLAEPGGRGTGDRAARKEGEMVVVVVVVVVATYTSG